MPGPLTSVLRVVVLAGARVAGIIAADYPTVLGQLASVLCIVTLYRMR